MTLYLFTKEYISVAYVLFFANNITWFNWMHILFECINNSCQNCIKILENKDLGQNYISWKFRKISMIGMQRRCGMPLPFLTLV